MIRMFMCIATARMPQHPPGGFYSYCQHQTVDTGGYCTVQKITGFSVKQQPRIHEEKQPSQVADQSDVPEVMPFGQAGDG